MYRVALDWSQDNKSDIEEATRLAEAALRAGNARLARALAAERTQLKPTSPFNWQIAARALDAVGDSDGAMKARDSAEMRRKAQMATRAVA